MREGMINTWFGISPHRSAQWGLVSSEKREGDLEDTITATGTLQPKAYVDVGTQVSVSLFKALGGGLRLSDPSPEPVPGG